MRSIFRVLVSAAALAIASSAMAQQYPAKPVKVIVPFGAGGPTDVVARMVMQGLSERLKQQFYVENVAGAGGNIGMGQAARAAGDGYTLLFASSSIVVNPSLYNKVPYDYGKDFAPVTKIGAAPNALIVHPSLNVKTVKELVDLLKANPGKYTFASPGLGTTPSLSVELFRQTFGLDFQVTQFKSGGLAIQSVLGGHTPMSFQAIPPATALIREGKVRALAITASKRLGAFPDVPTLGELGIKGQEAETMQGLFAPAGTSKDIIALLQREIAEIVKQPAMREKLLALGVGPEGMPTDAFIKYCNDEIAKWSKVIKDAKIPKI
jgi:tripartite-type tricarboxylate transporter receptor subunit TctC